MKSSSTFRKPGNRIWCVAVRATNRLLKRRTADVRVRRLCYNLWVDFGSSWDISPDAVKLAFPALDDLESPLT
jgi:hypothetical protein